MYVIWSHQHEAWWGPDRAGYTTDLAEAGRYTLEEAGEIVVPVIPSGIEVAVDERVAESHGLKTVYGANRLTVTGVIQRDSRPRN